MLKIFVPISFAALALCATSASAGTKVSNNLSTCNSGKGPAVLVTITGIKNSEGKIRVQSYKANSSEWLARGKWLHRIESSASQGTMSICVPITAGNNTYGIAVRHDRNANGKTDISKDGGGFSNNPSLNIFNLGKPSYKKVGFTAGSGVTRITINMKYM
ncbi:hypothetical protein LPB140_03995 [Sphingorhabdus lutea]|uniref:DUF2141 domain-containing protein n=1 Tax=Sphingorhabdus lutea TaxID=1913578 RepID=A0A1L3JAG2_9SPHN|nr:DUF2141 domain-containing protein [Sphingorhabdus lutea]APG62108.1 hypothetical protein LPB140_03995 [Sphingorhabdus lutea]